MMGMVLVIVGGASFAGYLVWLIVRTVQWDSKIPPIIGMLLSVVMVVGGLSAIPRAVRAAEDIYTKVTAAIEIILPPKGEAPETPEEPDTEEADAAAN